MFTTEPGRAFVLISGQLQGLGFHEWLRGRATDLGLRGGVRYFARGRVEAIFSGDSEAVRAVLLSLREGPEFARLSGMEAEVQFTDCPTLYAFAGTAGVGAQQSEGRLIYAGSARAEETTLS